MRRWLGALFAVQLAGCSLVLTREPRFAPDRPGEPVECTESRVAPALDAGLAAALYASAVALVVWGASYRDALDAFDGRSPATGAAWASPQGEMRTGAARSCGIAARGERKYCMGE